MATPAGQILSFFGRASQNDVTRLLSGSHSQFRYEIILEGADGVKRTRKTTELQITISYSYLSVALVFKSNYLDSFLPLYCFLKDNGGT